MCRRRKKKLWNTCQYHINKQKSIWHFLSVIKTTVKPLCGRFQFSILEYEKLFKWLRWSWNWKCKAQADSRCIWTEWIKSGELYNEFRGTKGTIQVTCIETKTFKQRDNKQQQNKLTNKQTKRSTTTTKIYNYFCNVTEPTTSASSFGMYILYSFLWCL